jgi:arsenate reductase
MTTSFTLYHNPNCSKSRAVLALLYDRNVTLTVINYLNNPPDAAMLNQLLTLLTRTPRELMRTTEATYRQANIDHADVSHDELVAAMVEYPILIERPIVVKHCTKAGSKAIIGRPPENIEVLFT